ncbi:MAG: DNA-3-methyladenine glycosylase I [Dehalococcoidia bacterium]|nr:hypothetical protein [Chloroflexota bacterium]MDP6055240.1 DNA-3-methyladenine glycosylase I [Dehalococcoidia bacterium]MDP7484877.1 DNA-3-methyladenine glycosylase I [Dehalococcoidia bacterium]
MDNAIRRSTSLDCVGESRRLSGDSSQSSIPERKAVESKWSTIRKAFHEFQIGAVAVMDEAAVDELADDKRVIRNRRKLQVITDNVCGMTELKDDHGSFQQYLRSHDSFGDLVKNLRKEFKFMGEMGCYYWLYVVGEDVPDHDQFETEQAPRK